MRATILLIISTAAFGQWKGEASNGETTVKAWVTGDLSDIHHTCGTKWCVEYRIDGAAAEVQIDVGGVCKHKPEQWYETVKSYGDGEPRRGFIVLDGSWDCTIDVGKISFAPADVDFTAQLQRIIALRDVAARQRAIEQDLQLKAHADEQERIRAGCARVYAATIDVKRSDLTVRQDEQVKACQQAGLYRP